MHQYKIIAMLLLEMSVGWWEIITGKPQWDTGNASVRESFLSWDKMETKYFVKKGEAEKHLGGENYMPKTLWLEGVY